MEELKLDELKFFNGGRSFVAYHKGKQKFDIYSGSSLVGLGVDLLLVKMLYDYCQGHQVPLILGQEQKDIQNALVWWHRQPRLTQLIYSNEIFGKPDYGESDDLDEVDIVKIWKAKS